VGAENDPVAKTMMRPSARTGGHRWTILQTSDTELPVKGSGPLPQFQYFDIGVNMEITPTIHFNGDVSLKVKVEITSQNGTTTISGVDEPIIGQQSVEELICLKEGESNIHGGLLQERNNRSLSGTPGLGEIPLLKYLFSTQKTEVQHKEIVFRCGV
jgi:general secretion pathway protein D